MVTWVHVHLVGTERALLFVLFQGFAPFSQVYAALAFFHLSNLRKHAQRPPATELRQENPRAR